LGINYEAPVAKKLTLDSGAGLTAGYTVNNGINYKTNFTHPCLYLKSELKYYYNFNKKLKLLIKN